MSPALSRRSPRASTRGNVSRAPGDRHRSPSVRAAVALVAIWACAATALALVLPTAGDLAFDAAPRALVDLAFPIVRAIGAALAIGLGVSLRVGAAPPLLSLAEQLSFGLAAILGLGAIAQLALGIAGVAPSLAHLAATVGVALHLALLVPLSAALARALGGPAAVVAAATLTAIGWLHPVLRAVAGPEPDLAAGLLLALTPDLDRLALHGVAAHSEPFPWLTLPYGAAWVVASLLMFGLALPASNRGGRTP